MERGTDRGYFPNPAKSLFILDTPGQEEVAREKFLAEGMVLNFVSMSRYLGAYLGPQEELAAWVKPQVGVWVHGVRVIVKIARQHPQLACASLGILLQLEWQYLQIVVPSPDGIIISILTC